MGSRTESPEAGLGFGTFLAIALQLGLVLGVVLLYRIELERGFATVAALIFVGFLIHSWLPLNRRMPFFFLLTICAIAILLKADAIWLVGLGLGLVGLCHLPISWLARVALVGASAAVLAVLMAGWVHVSWANIVIPILAAMFMFRLMLYLYDLKNDRTRAGLWQRLSYFFLLPNVCFPLFPVVDYKTFLRSYYDAPAAEIYQKGIYWMLRGVSHLLLYRFVYYLMPRAESDLSGILGVYVFMAMTYALYLRVSGLFHLIIGSLCLFGFNLPRPNNYYFLASSFTDLWRRINIYYKDFMMTTVFYPVFLSLRRLRMSHRLVFATGVVFFVTWFLHSYQWFWLQGVFPITGPDMVHWGFLGALLAANSVWEARRGRRRAAVQPIWSWKTALSISARTMATFSIMALSWSLWYSESFADWWYRMIRVRESGLNDWAVFITLVTGVLFVGVVGQWLGVHGWGLARIERLALRQASRLVPAASLAILVVGIPSISSQAGRPIERIVNRVKSTELNRLDRERQERGYYETLSRATQLGPALAWAQPEDWKGLEETAAVRPTGDLRGYELFPDLKMQFKGALLTTNRFGLRDREYERKKAPGTFRIALLGSSHVMGSGVANNETFENVLEDTLNRELAGRGFERYEILNFAVGGYGLLQTLYVAERRVPEFEPDVIISVAHPGEAVRLEDRLRQMLKRGAQLEGGHDFLQRVLERADVDSELPSMEFSHRLKPYRDEMLRWSYGRMVEVILGNGAVPVFVFLPLTDGRFSDGELAQLVGFARETGAVVITMQDVYKGYDRALLRIAEHDNHPNALGHRLVADRLYTSFLENAEALGLFSETVSAAGGSGR